MLELAFELSVLHHSVNLGDKIINPRKCITTIFGSILKLYDFGIFWKHLTRFSIFNGFVRFTHRSAPQLHPSTSLVIWCFPNLIWRASVLHIELRLVAEAEAAVQMVKVNWI